MKGEDYIPGKDPLLDRALAELRKDLRPGEDPFYIDINARRKEAEEEAARQEANEERPTTDHSFVPVTLHEWLIKARRYRLRGSFVVGGAVAILVLVGYMFGVFSERGAKTSEAVSTNAPPPVPSAHVPILAPAPTEPAPIPDERAFPEPAARTPAASRRGAPRSSVSRPAVSPMAPQPSSQSTSKPTATPPPAAAASATHPPKVQDPYGDPIF
ncbi:MAG TPA: hypothetical protein VF881_07170 [Polyangiaceae bacterium]